MKIADLVLKHGLEHMLLPQPLRESQDVFTASELSAAWKIYIICCSALSFFGPGGTQKTDLDLWANWSDQIWEILSETRGSPAYKIAALFCSFCEDYMPSSETSDGAATRNIAPDVKCFADLMADIAKFPYHEKFETEE